MSSLGKERGKTTFRQFVTELLRGALLWLLPTAEQNAMEALASWKAASMRASNAKKATGPRLRA